MSTFSVTTSAHAALRFGPQTVASPLKRVAPVADARSVSGISGVGGGHAPQSYEGAVMAKAKQQLEVEGEASMKLIESASSTSRAPAGTGKMVNTVA